MKARRTFGFLSAAVMVISMLAAVSVTGTVAAAEMQIRTAVYDAAEKGTDISGGYGYPAFNLGTAPNAGKAITVKAGSPVGVGPLHSAVLDAKTEVAGNAAAQENGARSDTAVFTQTVITDYTDEKYRGFDSLLLYVELPAGADGDRLHLQPCFGVNGGAAWVYPYLGAGAAFSTLTKGAAQWTQHTTDGVGTLSLPAGFAGYVRVPYSAFTLNTSTTDYAPGTTFVYDVKIAVDRFGGEYGAVTVAFIGVSAGQSASEAAVDGGKAQPFFPASAVWPDLTGLRICPFTYRDAAPGTDISAGYGYSLAGDAAGVTATAAAPMGIGTLASCLLDSGDGIADNLKIGENGARDTSAVYTDTIVDDYTDAKYLGFGGLLLAVELPAGSDGGRLHLQPCFGVNGGATWIYPYVDVGTTFFTYDKRADGWSRSTVQSIGAIDLPGGFCGYICLPYDSFSVNTAVEPPYAPESTFPYDIKIAFDRFGGGYGAVRYQAIGVTDLPEVDSGSDDPADELRAMRLQTIVHGEDGYVLYTEGRGEPGVDPEKGIALTGHAAFGIGKNGAVVLDAPAEIAGNAAADPATGDRSAGDIFTDTVITDYTDAKYLGHDSLLLYVKLPQGKKNAIHLQPCFGVNGGKEWVYPYPAAGAAYHTLAVGKTGWTERETDALGRLVLPAGFEGYVRVPYAAFTRHTASTDYRPETTFPYDLKIAFDRFGGEYGAVAYQFIGVTAGMSKSGAAVDGEKQIRDLFTGAAMTQQELDALPEDAGSDAPDRDPSDPDDIGNVTRAWLLLDTSAWTVGEDLAADRKNGLIEIFQRDENDPGTFKDVPSCTLTAVKSPVGLTDAPAIRFDDPTAVTDDARAEGRNAFVFNVQRSLKGNDSFLLYVEMPQNDSERNALYIQGCVEQLTQKGKWFYPRMAAGSTVYLLRRGETSWETVATEGAQNASAIPLPGGFAGYIRIPFESFNFSVDTATLTEKHSLYYYQLRFARYGGEFGGITVGPMMLAGGPRSKNGVVFADSGRVQDLFTGAQLTPAQVYEDPNADPAIGSIFYELPEETCDLEVRIPDDEDIRKDGVHLTWDEDPAAAAYKLWIFEVSVNESGSRQFVFRGGLRTEKTAADFSGLTAGTSYAALVTSLDGKGADVNTYLNAKFVTPADEDTDPSGPDKTDPGTDDPADDGKQDPADAPKTGVALPWIALPVAAAALLSVFLLKKKKA